MPKWTYTIDGASHDDQRIIFNTTFYADGEKYQNFDLTAPVEVLPKFNNAAELEGYLAAQAKEIATKIEPRYTVEKKAEDTKDGLKDIIESLAGVIIDIP